MARPSRRSRESRASDGGASSVRPPGVPSPVILSFSSCGTGSCPPPPLGPSDPPFKSGSSIFEHSSKTAQDALSRSANLSNNVLRKPATPTDRAHPSGPYPRLCGVLRSSRSCSCCGATVSAGGTMRSVGGLGWIR